MTSAKLCVVTSVAAEAEPRAPRHAAMLAKHFPDVCVHLLDAAATPIVDTLPVLQGLPNVRHQRVAIATKAQTPWRRMFEELQHRAARKITALGGPIFDASLSAQVIGLSQRLIDLQARCYFVHQIECLWPAYLAAKANAATLIFDSMEFHAEMSADQPAIEKALIDRIQREVLPQCAMVVTATQQIANGLQARYGIHQLIAVRNVPEPKSIEMRTAEQPLKLYWRNAMLGLGQRGLQDAIQALSMLPGHIALYLQGRNTPAGEQSIRELATQLGVAERVHLLPAHPPGGAVTAAAAFDIGLCLEHAGIGNHEMTVSNKFFDYHMAGLCVISSDTQSLKHALEQSGGGMCFQAGDAKSLAKRIETLDNDRALLQKLRDKARAYALAEANLDHELAGFAEQLLPIVRRSLML